MKHHGTRVGTSQPGMPLEGMTRREGDICIPLTINWGLLSTAALHQPSHLDHTSILPIPSLHVHEIQRSGDLLSDHLNISSCIPCCSKMPCPIHTNSHSSLLHCICLIQHLAYQTDGDYTTLHAHTNGLLTWPAYTKCICGDSQASSAVDTDVPSSPVYHLNHLTCDQLRLLWHQHLGHLHSQWVLDMHKFAMDILSVLLNTDLDHCPICTRAKLHKAAHGHSSLKWATQCFQGVSIDFGFMVQHSSNSEWVCQLTGLHGETCYCLITDHYSGMLHGAVFCSKAPPIKFLNTWLAQYGLPNSIANKYVCFDLGGELGHSTDIVELFQHAGYAVEPTAPDSLHQNGSGEHPHQSIAEGLWAMLGGAALESKILNITFAFIMLLSITPSKLHHIPSAWAANPTWVFFRHLDVVFMPCLLVIILPNWWAPLAWAFCLATQIQWKMCTIMTLFLDRLRLLHNMYLSMRLCMILLTNSWMLVSLLVYDLMVLRSLIQQFQSLILTSVHPLSCSFTLFVYILILQMNTFISFFLLL